MRHEIVSGTVVVDGYDDVSGSLAVANHQSSAVLALMTQTTSQQHRWTFSSLASPIDPIPTKDILPVTLRGADGNAQPEDQPEQYSISVWASNQHIIMYGQRIRFGIRPSWRNRANPDYIKFYFPWEAYNWGQRTGAIFEAKAGIADLKLWHDGSKAW